VHRRAGCQGRGREIVGFECCHKLRPATVTVPSRPPSVGARSCSTTSTPASAKNRAAVTPAMPPPMTPTLNGGFDMLQMGAWRRAARGPRKMSTAAMPTTPNMLLLENWRERVQSYAPCWNASLRAQSWNAPSSYLVIRQARRPARGAGTCDHTCVRLGTALLAAPNGGAGLHREQRKLRSPDLIPAQCAALEPLRGGTLYAAVFTVPLLPKSRRGVGERLAPPRNATHSARSRRSRVYVRPKQITPASRLGGT
jgi:hypothetical protein